MKWRLFAMDTHFDRAFGAYTFDARCEMLCELGYDATYLSLLNEPAWAELPLLAEARQRHGLEIAGVWFSLDLAGGEDHPGNLRSIQAIETTPGPLRYEVALRSSDAALARSDRAGDSAATRWIARLLRAAERAEGSVALYPHVNFWMERIEDALRLARVLEHPRLGVVFCGFHWYAVDGKDLRARLRDAAPWLRSVNLCGTRRLPDAKVPATIEPLDCGTLDHFALLGMLREINYSEMIGFQGYGMGGDPYANLRRSIQAFREMEARLDRHPAWTRRP